MYIISLIVFLINEDRKQNKKKKHIKILVNIEDTYLQYMSFKIEKKAI